MTGERPLSEIVALCPVHAAEFYVPHGGICPEPGCHEALVEYVPASQPRGAVVLSDDERKGLAWAARHGAHALRSEGWPDMKRNAEILDGVLSRLEGGQ